MKDEIMTFDELINSWSEDNTPVEQVICDAVGEDWPENGRKKFLTA